jgi:hypothetical protein
MAVEDEEMLQAIAAVALDLEEIPSVVTLVVALVDRLETLPRARRAKERTIRILEAALETLAVALDPEEIPLVVLLLQEIHLDLGETPSVVTLEDHLAILPSLQLNLSSLSNLSSLNKHKISLRSSRHERSRMHHL